MNIRRKRRHSRLEESDGEAIRNAVLDYISSSHESDVLSIREEIVQSEPEVDEQGNLHIGQWVYHFESNTLRKYLPPDRHVGYDYSLQLRRHGSVWKVVNLNRIEVFRSE